MARRSMLMGSTIEPASPDPPPGPAPRLWPAMTSAAQRDLAQQVARLLRRTLMAEDRVASEGDHAEHAVDLRRPGHDDAPSEAGLHLRAAVYRRASPPAPGE